MKISFRTIVINLLLLVTLSSCKNDPLDVDISKIELDFELKRFDKALFEVNFDSIEAEIATLYREFGNFFDVFNIHVANLGAASQRLYGSYLSMFVNDPQNREVYDEVQKVFPEMSAVNQGLLEAFKRYRYHFPDAEVPEVVTYMGGFNHKLFTVEGYVGVGLDQYLGRDCKYYDMLGTPKYMQRNMHPGKIVSDVVHVFGSGLFPYNDSVDQVISRMIYGGQLLYFCDVLMPDVADSVKVGFSPSQMKFVRSNERQMWTYLVEHKMLFSSDQLEIRKLTEDAPTTYYFPDASPGKAAVWIGWQMVREYARRNPELSVGEVLSERDYQKILRGSRYDP
jgi:hypothetical protein